MEKFALTFLAIVFPWIVLLMDDNPGGAVAALVMQATGIGWLPASLWALRIVREKLTQPNSNKEHPAQSHSKKIRTKDAAND